MATENLAGMREETAKELERIRGEVLVAKQELVDRFEYYFRVLREKHIEVEEQLDEVLRVVEMQVTDKQTQLNQLIIAKAEVSQNLSHNRLNQTLENVCREFDEKIKVLEATVVEVPVVWLAWHDKLLEVGVARLCRVCEGVSYVNRHNPVCSGADAGFGQNQILLHNAISTDIHNGDVYVCDYTRKRIQVFNQNATYKRTINPDGLIRHCSITNTLHHLFVSCVTRIYKIDKLSGNFVCSVDPEDGVSCLSSDTNTLYAGVRETNQIYHLSLEDLCSLKVTILESPHIVQSTTLKDLKIASSLFVALFEECQKPIQMFSRDGHLTQVVVSIEQLYKPDYLCVDRHLNVIVSDVEAHNLKIFSREGRLITTIGQRGEGPGKFIHPKGVDIDKDGRIAVVDIKDSHKLQFF